jgi:hypothetical protein
MNTGSGAFFIIIIFENSIVTGTTSRIYQIFESFRYINYHSRQIYDLFVLLTFVEKNEFLFLRCNLKKLCITYLNDFKILQKTVHRSFRLRERLTQIESKLNEVKAGRAPEYTQPLEELQVRSGSEFYHDTGSRSGS